MLLITRFSTKQQGVIITETLMQNNSEMKSTDKRHIVPYSLQCFYLQLNSDRAAIALDELCDHYLFYSAYKLKETCTCIKEIGASPGRTA